MSNSTTPAFANEGDQQIANKFAFRVFGGKGFDSDDPYAFKICNISSLCFFVVQAIYAIFLLFRLCRKTEKKPRRSRSLIAATAMILYSSIALCFLFGMPKLTIKA